LLIVALFALTTTAAAQQGPIGALRPLCQRTTFDEKGSRLWVLSYNLVPDSEHYGNLVTYFRIKGIMPPSSRAQ
jgi:hypothetical protein